MDESWKFDGIVINLKVSETEREIGKMNDAYFEILVARKPSSMLKIAQIATALLAGVSAVAMIMGFIWGILLTAAFGVACYLITLRNSVEYEYLYVDKELQIDRILGKSKRKRMETLDLNQLEMLAPIRSHELDGFRNRKGEKVDYSSGDETQDSMKYMLIVGDKQVIFEPTMELVKTIQMFAPRKVRTW